MPRRALKQQEWSERLPLTITITKAQRSYLSQLCLHHGPPGVPIARLASTAFTRGLTTIGDEIGHIWDPSKP